MDQTMCDSKDLLVSFLYGELDAAQRDSFRAHLASCAECRAELPDLRTTQRHLAAWAPPEPDLGFQIVRKATQPALPRRIGPLWGLAAAAVLVLAAGAALANVEVRYDASGLVLRTGWHRSGSAPATAVTARADTAGVTAVDWKQQSEALEQRVRQLEASLSAIAVATRGTDPTDAAVLKRVNELVDQSETRQQRVMAARLAQLTRDLDARRKVDLAVIDQGLMRLQTTSGAELRQSRDLMQRMYRATAYQPK
jgi:hypothetical protein